MRGTRSRAAVLAMLPLLAEGFGTLPTPTKCSVKAVHTSTLSGSNRGDRFGERVRISIDGSILAVSADRGGLGGYVRVYSLAGPKPVLIDTVSGGAAGDEFGDALALSRDGTILAVGAKQNDNSGAGYVRVYERKGGAYGVRSELSAAATAGFGEAVSLSHDGAVLAVGSTNRTVRVYRWSENAWTAEEVVEARPSDPEKMGGGDSVSLSADGATLAYATDAPAGDGRGLVHVYDYADGAWTLRDGSAASMEGSAARDDLGGALELSASGTVIIAGAKQGKSADEVGYVRVFEWEGAAWVQQGGDLMGSAKGDELGDAVALSAGGEIIAIGADQTPAGGHGYVQVFEWIDGEYSLVDAGLRGEQEGGNYGTTVDLNVHPGGKSRKIHVAVGAKKMADETGRAYLHTIECH